MIFIVSYCSCSFLASTEVEVSPVSAHSWVTTELDGLLEEMKIGIADCPVSVKQLASILGELNKGNISGLRAKKVCSQSFIKCSNVTQNKLV